MEEGEGSDREGRRKREEGMQKVRCKKVRELERGREAVSNSVWSPDPLYGADNEVLQRVWKQG